MKTRLIGRRLQFSVQLYIISIIIIIIIIIIIQHLYSAIMSYADTEALYNLQLIGDLKMSNTSLIYTKNNSGPRQLP